MSNFRINFILMFLLLFISCSKETHLNYTVLKDEVYDAPIKTQVDLEILINDTLYSEQNIRDILSFLYGKVKKRTGFKHHTHPTSIYIYAYSTMEKAKSGWGLWVGMISKSHNESKPKIEISDTQLNSLTEKPVEKFGLSEKIRIEIWKKYILVERRARKEADLKYPLNKDKMSMDYMKKNGILSSNLKEKYGKELAEEFEITIIILDDISLEGLTKGWALP